MVNDDLHLDPRVHTFSQAQGLEGVPRRLSLDEIPISVRKRLWNVFYRATTAAIPEPPIGYVGPPFVWGEWAGVILDLFDSFFHETVDEITAFDQHYGDVGARLDVIVSKCKPLFLEGPYHRLFDLLQHVMRHPECPPDYIHKVGRIFEEGHLAYTVDANGSPTIFPAAAAQEGEAIARARRELQAHGRVAANRHLQRAAELFGDGAWAESVHESINAVESVAKGLGTGGTTLGEVLKVLKRPDGEPKMHRTLLASLDKLNGYRGDAPGVGHAATEGEVCVGREEAALFIGTCASFCTFLLEKERKAKDSRRDRRKM